MAKNEVYKDADYLTLPVANGLLSGSPVRVGGLNGVLQTNEGDLVTNEEGFASVALKGAFRIPVATTTTLAIGAPVYIITASNTLTTTDNSAANPLFGHALSAKGSTANQPVIVRIAN